MTDSDNTVEQEINLEDKVYDLYRRLTGNDQELSDVFTIDHCLRAIEEAFLRVGDAHDQAVHVQKTETLVIQKIFQKLLDQEITPDNQDVVRDCLEKGQLQCERILEEMPLKIGALSEDEEDEDPSAHLIDVIISAVTDPSLYDDFQGDRSLSEWQQDAVLEALNQTGFDLVSEYDAFNDNDLETLKAELNIANALIERLYQRSFDQMDSK